MRFVTATAVIAAALIAGTLPLAAAAAGVTIGGNVGSARTNGGDFDGSDTGWKVDIGSSYKEVIGGQVGYVNFGKLGGDGPEVDAWAPALTLGAPIGNARLYAKGGYAFAEESGTSVRDDAKHDDPFYGVGLSFGMTRGLGFRAEYERYTLSHEDIDMAQAGLELKF
jgi:OmpA-OmpF porin, OOP family